MKKILDKYSIQQINYDIPKIVNEKKVNNIKMIVMPRKDSKLSVTLRRHSNQMKFYHGLSPKFDVEYLMNFLSNIKINEVKTFWKMINEIQNKEDKLFNLFVPLDIKETDSFILEYVKNVNEKEKLEICLLGKAVLQMGSHFGYELAVDVDMDIKSILNVLVPEVEGESIEDNIYFKYDETNHKLQLLGIWPVFMIDKICSNLHINESDNGFLLKMGKEDNNCLKNLLQFNGDHWRNSLKLLNSDIYYSGVMPCVKSIDLELSESISNDIKYFIFNVIRTTYATVDTFDNSRILCHNFFENSTKKILFAFDNYEDNLQSTYLYTVNDNLKLSDDAYEKIMIENLNSYLKNSFNTHTIAVSANLITSDGYLIAGKRSSQSIDSGEYYCSANGQSEFRDENVSFYRKSVFEDIPTMDFESEYRIDLTHEIERECIAELGITSYSPDWNYCGVSYLSIHNEIDKNFSCSISKPVETIYRRMHFNVLTSNVISQTFKEVIENHKHATERFENESFIGIKTRLIYNGYDFIKLLLLISYKWIDRNKSNIFLFLLFISILLGEKSYKTIEMNNYFDLLFLLIYLWIFLYNYYKERKIRKKIFTKYIYIPNYIENNILDMDKVLKNLSNKIQAKKFHAIFNIMYILHFLQKIDETSLD